MAPIKTDLKDKTYRHQGFQKQCPATKNCNPVYAAIKHYKDQTVNFQMP